MPKRFLTQNQISRPTVCLIVLLAFFANLIGPVPKVLADDLVLPAPGVMVPLSPSYDPPILKGIKIDPQDPFKFEFILDKADVSSNVNDPALRVESTKLIKYFLASLTIPEKDLWVNLSPYEKERIVPQIFGQTQMGRDLLAEDYMLKQITASLIYPEGETGKKFWQRVYTEAFKRFGTTNVPVNTFNKVWIVPEKAVVYENINAGTAYVVESRLKVMLDQDYLATAKNLRQSGDMFSRFQTPNENTKDLSSQISRQIVIPELIKEVNHGQSFAKLRQVYNSFILASWYKKKIKESILSTVYANKNKVDGIQSSSLDPQQIYQQYLQAFKKGAYNYIKEEQDPITRENVTRKYFSGGTQLSDISQITHDASSVQGELDHAMLINVTLRTIGKFLPWFSSNENKRLQMQALVNTFRQLKDFNAEHGVTVLMNKGSQGQVMEDATDIVSKIIYKKWGEFRSLLDKDLGANPKYQKRLKKDPGFLNPKKIVFQIIGSTRYLKDPVTGKTDWSLVDDLDVWYYMPDSWFEDPWMKAYFFKHYDEYISTEEGGFVGPSFQSRDVVYVVRQFIGTNLSFLRNVHISLSLFTYHDLLNGDDFTKQRYFPHIPLNGQDLSLAPTLNKDAVQRYLLLYKELFEKDALVHNWMYNRLEESFEIYSKKIKRLIQLAQMRGDQDAVQELYKLLQRIAVKGYFSDRSKMKPVRAVIDANFDRAKPLYSIEDVQHGSFDAVMSASSIPANDQVQDAAMNAGAPKEAVLTDEEKAWLKDTFSLEEIIKYANSLVAIRNDFDRYDVVPDFFVYALPALRNHIKDEDDLKRAGEIILGLMGQLDPRMRVSFLRNGVPAMRRFLSDINDLSRIGKIYADLGRLVGPNESDKFYEVLLGSDLIVKNENDLNQYAQEMIDLIKKERFKPREVQAFMILKYHQKEEAIEQVTSLLGDKNWRVRYYILKGMTRSPLEDDFFDLYLSQINYPNRFVRMAAVEGIGRFNNQPAKSVLFRSLLDPDPRIVSEAVHALENIATEDDIAYLASLIRDEPPTKTFYIYDDHSTVVTYTMPMDDDDSSTLNVKLREKKQMPNELLSKVNGLILTIRERAIEKRKRMKLDLSAIKDQSLKEFLIWLKQNDLEDIVIIGGGVRDAYLGKVSADFDISVAVPLEMQEYLDMIPTLSQANPRIYEYAMRRLGVLAKALGVDIEDLFNKRKKVLWHGKEVQYSGPIRLKSRDGDFVYIKRSLVDKDSLGLFSSSAGASLLQMGVDPNGQLYGRVDAIDSIKENRVDLIGDTHNLDMGNILRLIRIKYEFGFTPTIGYRDIIKRKVQEFRTAANFTKINFPEVIIAQLEKINNAAMNKESQTSAYQELDELGIVALLKDKLGIDVQDYFVDNDSAMLARAATLEQDSMFVNGIGVLEHFKRVEDNSGDIHNVWEAIERDTHKKYFLKLKMSQYWGWEWWNYLLALRVGANVPHVIKVSNDKYRSIKAIKGHYIGKIDETIGILSADIDAMGPAEMNQQEGSGLEEAMVFMMFALLNDFDLWTRNAVKRNIEGMDHYILFDLADTQWHWGLNHVSTSGSYIKDTMDGTFNKFVKASLGQMDPHRLVAALRSLQSISIDEVKAMERQSGIKEEINEQKFTQRKNDVIRAIISGLKSIQDSNPKAKSLLEALQADQAMTAEELYDFDNSEARVGSLEAVIREVGKYVGDGHIKPVIVGGTRYMASGARKDIDILLEGSGQDEHVWREYILALASYLNEFEGIHAKVLTDKYDTDGRYHVEPVKIVLMDKRGNIADINLDIMLDFGDIHFMRKNLRTIWDMPTINLSILQPNPPASMLVFKNKIVEEIYIKDYFKMEYYLGDPDIYRQMIIKFRRSQNFTDFLADGTVYQRIIGLRDQLDRLALGMNDADRLNKYMDDKIAARLAQSATPDFAMTNDIPPARVDVKKHLGGIDFNPARMDLEVKGQVSGIKFHLDPAQLAQLQHATGFVPVITDIQPLGDLRQFLGITSLAIDKSSQ